jgi:mRNA interferase MazF
VIVSSGAYNAARPDVIIMAITSQLRASGALGEVLLSNWQRPNLLKPSAVKAVFATIEASLILVPFGALNSADQVALRTAIATVLG